MSRMQNLRVVDPVLSSLAVGYSNASYIADYLFPMAPVPKEGGQIPQHNKQMFKIFATERALRAKSNRLDPDDRNFISFKTDEHDISVPMDYREGEESDDLDVEGANTFLAMEALQLRREKIAADIAFNPASYGAGNKVALAAGAKWSVNTNNPLLDISTGINAIRQGIARRPNQAVVGASAFETLKNNPFILERMAANMMGILTADILAQIIGVQRVIVGDAIWASDDGATVADVWGNSFLLTYSRPAGPNGKRSVFEPNYGYTVYKKKVEVDKYLEEGGKVQNVRATMNYKTVLVGADAGYLISGVN